MQTNRGCGLWVGVFAALVSCQGGETKVPGLEGRCSGSHACDGDDVCVDGKCTPPCAESEDCPTQAFRCLEGGCVPVAGASCDSHDDCANPAACQVASGAACREGACEYQALGCASPPASACVGANDVFRSYVAQGACNAATAACEYDSLDFPCPNCNAVCLRVCEGVSCAPTTAGGCQRDGACSPTDPPSCVYQDELDGVRCDRDGEPVGSQSGLCLAGDCVECIDDVDCVAPPGQAECFAPTCGPSGACTYAPISGAICAAATCTAGVASTARQCGADGTCMAAATSSCAPYACGTVGAACGTGCATDADCSAGAFCNGAFACETRLADGNDCSANGDHACQSGHCDGRFCCAAGDCCNVASDCPASYASTSSCTDASPATVCQGTRNDRACVAHQCTASTVDDDSGCGGLTHDCASYASIACTSSVSQSAPSCSTTCTSDVDCSAGRECQGNACVPLAGLGDTCTGTCGSGLKCENARCCATGGATCCDDDSQCGQGLACDLGTSSCFVTCNDRDASRCADPVNTVCSGNTCVPRAANGSSCSHGAECSSGSCVESVCCGADCTGVCQSCREASTGQPDGVCAPILLGLTDAAPLAQCTSSGDGCSGGTCACDGAGGCRSAVGASCLGDSTCASGICECGDAQCTTGARRCATARCGTCMYTTNGVACTAGLGSPGPIDDPQDCATVASCFGGACRSHDGQPCAANSDCENSCLASVCAARSTLSGACDPGDDGDCAAPLVCAGVACLRPDGQACVANAECANTCVGLACHTLSALGDVCDGGDDADCQPGMSCTSGRCRLVDGEVCAQNGDCAHTCVGGVCQGRAVLADPCDTGEADDCQAGMSCPAGTCRLDNGTTCVADASCALGHCECADVACAQRVCASASCACGWASTGACSNVLGDDVVDPEDCDSPGRACFGGNCRIRSGEACSSDGSCASGQCECTTDQCDPRVCAADCDCGYGVAGECSTALPDGVDDPGDCDVAGSSCYSGACLADPLSGCVDDASCGTGQCECANASCTQRICALASCTCGWGAAGECTGNLNSAVSDPGDCEGAQACWGGACRSINGEACTSNNDCGSGQCECANAACTARVCNGSSCTCRYGANGDCLVALDDGVVDPADCDTGNVCFGGACLKGLGLACASNAECGSSQCECTDASCSTRVCAASDCDCNYGVGGVCTSALADGNDDPEDCALGGYSCYGGACLKDDYQLCTSNGECRSGQCECTDAACTSNTRVCALASCTCRYGLNGVCSTLLTNDTVDPGDCDNGRACFTTGGCLTRNGSACTANAECQSGQCECADSGCTARLCSAVDCPACRYSSGGTCTTTTNYIADGVDDFDNTCVARSCNGAGVCNLANGVACTSDQLCESNHCECADASCLSRVCSAVDCPDCKFASGGTCTTTTNNIADGLDDADNTCGALSCNGAGACNLANGIACPLVTGDTACESNQCECATADCTAKVCSGIDCPLCTFNSDGDGLCEGPVNDNVDDADNSCAARTCNGLGACNLINGAACANNQSCDSNQCECSNVACTTRMCSAVDCPDCKYASGGTCTVVGANIQDGTDDFDNTCGALSCNGSGACNKDVGQACTANIECESNQCECIDGACSAKVCSTVDCDCQFNATGDGTCDGALGSGLDDPDNSCGALACSGLGACYVASGQACTVSAECNSGQCECSNNGCSARICSAVDCPPCKFASGTTCTITTNNIADGVDDFDNTCGTLSCNGAGLCNLTDGAVCSADLLCENNQCECSDAACTSILKECSNVDCPRCTFNADGDGTCEGVVQDGTDDADNSCGTGVCNGSGACRSVANGGACLVNGDCTSGQCECANGGCTSKICSAVDCPVCKFASGTTCTTTTNNISNGTDDADDSCGATACNGTGACN